jgi:hypothetical protein
MNKPTQGDKMANVLFTKASEHDSSVTVTAKRLVDAGVLKAVPAIRGYTVVLNLVDHRGKRQKALFMVNRVNGGYVTLRSLTSIYKLAQPRVGCAVEYKVSKKQ